MRLSGLSRGMDASFGAENMPPPGRRSSDGVRHRAFVAVRTRTLLSVAGNRVSSGRQAAAGALFPDRLFSCGPAHRLFRKSNGLGGRAVRLDGRPLSDRLRHGDSIPAERCLPLRLSVRLPLCEREWMPIRQ